MKKIDRSKIKVSKRRFRFRPFHPESNHAHLLKDQHLPPDTELMAFERGDQRRVLLVEEMMYHHVAQGDLAGEPYLVTF